MSDGPSRHSTVQSPAKKLFLGCKKNLPHPGGGIMQPKESLLAGRCSHGAGVSRFCHETEPSRRGDAS